MALSDGSLDMFVINSCGSGGPANQDPWEFTPDVTKAKVQKWWNSLKPTRPVDANGMPEPWKDLSYVTFAEFLQFTQADAVSGQFKGEFIKVYPGSAYGLYEEDSFDIIKRAILKRLTQPNP